MDDFPVGPLVLDFTNSAFDEKPAGGATPQRFVASITVFPSIPCTLSRASAIAPPGTATSTASASETSPPSRPILLTPWPALDTATWDASHRGGLRPTAALLLRATARMGAGGVVVLVGSIEGLRAAPSHAAYAVAKAAVHHLTGAAASEVGRRGIRVVGVAPGLVARAGLEEAWPEGVERFRRASALGRPVTPEEVAATVAFLASPAASGITGTTVPVDAGWSTSPGW